MNRERGSASVWVLGCIGLIGMLAFAATLQVAAVLCRHKAESAADLAALAAAGRIGVGGDPCTEATRIAVANGALMTACELQVAEDGRSGDVRVQVARDVRFPVVGLRHVTARARAKRLPPPD